MIRKISGAREEDLEDVWTGPTPPPNGSHYLWIQNGTLLASYEVVGWLGMCADMGTCSGLDFLKIMCQTKTFPWRGIRIYETDESKRNEMVDYLKKQLPKNGADLASPNKWDRIAIESSTDGGVTFVNNPY